MCFRAKKEKEKTKAKMGNEASMQMDQIEATNFDAEEIKRLGKRFKKLDLDKSGSLTVEEFMSLPGTLDSFLFEKRDQIYWE